MLGKEMVVKSLYGAFFSLISMIFNILSQILVRKTTFFSAYETALIRFIVQFIVLFTIAKYNKIEVFGSKKCRPLLFVRGIIGSFGMNAHYTSLKLIDPSDTIALFSSHVIFVVILSRIFLKEKIKASHVLAAFIVILGVLFIAQPSFLFPQQIQNKEPNVSVNKYIKYFGYFAAILSGLIYAECSIIVKILSKENTHYSVVNLFASYFGVPITGSFVLFSLISGNEVKDISDQSMSLLYEIAYNVLSGLLGVICQIFWIMSIKFDDPSRISMYKTAELLLMFILQYYLLGIKPQNYFNIIGATLITVGMILIMGMKLYEKNKEEKDELNDLQLDGETNELKNDNTRLSLTTS